MEGYEMQVLEGIDFVTTDIICNVYVLKTIIIVT